MADAGRQIDLWLIPRGANAIRPAREVSHFAGTKFAFRFRRNANAQGIGDQLGHFANAHAPAAADIYRKAIELVGFRSKEIRTRDVLDKRKIAGLLEYRD